MNPPLAHPPATSAAGQGLRLVAALLALSACRLPLLRADVMGHSGQQAVALYNLARFVEWPAEAFPTPQARLQICVVANNLLAYQLTRNLSGKTLQGRTLQVVELQDLSRSRFCQVVFLGYAPRKALTQCLQEVNGRSVLTISDVSGFRAAGGMVAIQWDGDLIRFEINLEAMARAHLKLSSRVLSLPHTVSVKAGAD